MLRRQFVHLPSVGTWLRRLPDPIKVCPEPTLRSQKMWKVKAWEVAKRIGRLVGLTESYLLWQREPAFACTCWSVPIKQEKVRMNCFVLCAAVFHNLTSIFIAPSIGKTSSQRAKSFWTSRPFVFNVCKRAFVCHVRPGGSNISWVALNGFISWQAPSTQIRIPERPCSEPLEEFQAGPISPVEGFRSFGMVKIM